MRTSVIAAAAAMVFSSPTHAIAQQYQCLDNLSRKPGFPAPPDHQASFNWERLGTMVDQASMQAMVGVWYGESRNPQGNQIQYIYSSFEANGLYQYRDQTCGAPNICSNNQGHGSFRAARQPDGSILVMINVSDLNRQQQCVSDQVTFPNPNTMVSRNGMTWRRVK